MTRKSVLLIEDSKLHQSFIRRALDGSRYDLAVVESGIEGLSSLSKKRFDVVVVDLLLPDINGLSVIRTIREMKQVASIPALVLTSRSSLDYANDISELNIAAFIEKSSFRADDFLQQLDRAIDATELKRDVEILLLEADEQVRQYIQNATGEPRFIFNEVTDRSTLEAFASSSVPDIIVYAHPANVKESPNWILSYYIDGVIKDVPWIVLFENQIPREFASLADNRLLMPLATPCSDIVLKKNIEILAQVHQTRLSSQEHSLELELVCSELEKNRISLSQARSELSHRKETFGDILIKMSTEIRRPLTSILGYSEGLKLSSTEDSRKIAIDAIANNGKYLAQVVEDILSIAAIEKGRFQVYRQKFDLLAIVNDLREVARIRAKANKVSFAVRFENDIPAEVESDPTLIKQILRGLIDNALKFTTDGLIELKLSYHEQLNQLKLVVRDTGPGIPPDKLSAILNSSSTFTPTSTAIAAGSGFGVSYVRFAAEQLGGDLRVDSKAGEGSTFSVSIDPGECSETLSPELAYTILELGSQDKETNLSNIVGKALISDVSTESQKLYRFLLDRTEVRYDFVKDGFETLDRALTKHPDILITDILQTDYDGFAFIRNLRKRGFSKPILCVSAFQYEEQRQRFIDVGCDALLDTPFRVEQFYLVLSQLLKNASSETVPEEIIESANMIASESTIEAVLEIPEDEFLQPNFEPMQNQQSDSLSRALDQEQAFLEQLPSTIVEPLELALVPEVLLPVDWESNSVVEALVVEFIDILPQQMLRIETALLSRDFQQATDATEELRSAAAIYGYQRLAEAAQEFIAYSNDGRMEEAQQLRRHLSELVNAIRNGRAQVLSSASLSSSTVVETDAECDVDTTGIPEEVGEPLEHAHSNVDGDSREDSDLQQEIHSLFVEQAISAESTSAAESGQQKNNEAVDAPQSIDVIDSGRWSIDHTEQGVFESPATIAEKTSETHTDDAALLEQQAFAEMLEEAQRSVQIAAEADSAAESTPDVEALSPTSASPLVATPLAVQTKLIQANADTTDFPQDVTDNLQIGMSALEEIGDALMGNNWQEASVAVENLLPVVLALESPGATQLVLKLKVALQTKNVERSAVLLDQISALLPTPERSVSPQPTGEEQQASEQSVESEINALLAELENEVGLPMELNEPDVKPRRKVRLSTISDTTIFKLFGLDDPSVVADASASNEHESIVETSDHDPSTVDAAEHTAVEGVGKTTHEHEEQLIDPVQAASTSASETEIISDDEVLAMVEATRQEMQATIISTLVEKEPSTAPLILDFLDELKDLLAKLRTAYGRKDDEMMKHIIDEVYGSAGICGYDSCAQLARALSTELDEGETEKVAPLLSEFETVCEAMFRGRNSLLNWQ